MPVATDSFFHGSQTAYSAQLVLLYLSKASLPSNGRTDKAIQAL